MFGVNLSQYLGSTNSWVPDAPRVGTGAAWMWCGGACAVLVHRGPFPFSTR